MPQETINVGDIICGGKYRLDEIIGEGSMGTVFRAIHLSLGRKVAIKILDPQRLRDRESTERFFREAQALARVKNERVVEIYDIETTEGGIPFIVMELLEGEALDGYLEKKGIIEIGEAIRIIIQILTALSAVHKAGITHRDIKPANIFLTKDGKIKLLDFGIVRTLGSDTITELDLALGTPIYMSLEQARGKRLDFRTDIWSAGVILYEMLTGAVPFSGLNPLAIIEAINHGRFRLPSKLTNIPAKLEGAILKAMARDLDERFQNADEFIEALRPFTFSPPLPEPTPDQTQYYRGFVKTLERESKRPVIVGLILLTLVIVVFVTFFSIYRPASETTSLTSPDSSEPAEHDAGITTHPEPNDVKASKASIEPIPTIEISRTAFDADVGAQKHRKRTRSNKRSPPDTFSKKNPFRSPGGFKRDNPYD